MSRALERDDKRGIILAFPMASMIAEMPYYETSVSPYIDLANSYLFRHVLTIEMSQNRLYNENVSCGAGFSLCHFRLRYIFLSTTTIRF